MDLAQSETSCTWRRPLYGTWEISLVPDHLCSGRFRKADGRTLDMYAGEKSDRATEEASEQWEATTGGGCGGKGLAQGEQPSRGRSPDSEPGNCVDPNGGCAPGDERVQTAQPLTFDLREEPGALVAHAGICAGGAG